MMKKVFSLLITMAPFSGVRIFLLRVLLGYKIDYKSKVGFANVIVANSFEMNAGRIGRFNYIDAQEARIDKALIYKLNRIKHIGRLEMSENSIVLSKNFIGGSRLAAQKMKQNLILGKDSEILRSNYFDVTDEIIVGKNVVFGGNGSEIWTHGFDTDRTLLTGSVEFGDDIFIGSKCIFTKGIKIASETSIGPGSVVYKSIVENGLYSSQQLVKIK